MRGQRNLLDSCIEAVFIVGKGISQKENYILITEEQLMDIEETK